MSIVIIIIILIIVIRLIILVIRLYNCNMSIYSNKSNYSNNYYKSNSNCNTIWKKKLTEIGSLLHRMHNVK